MKKFVSGLIMGLVLAISTVAFANGSLSAVFASFNFEVNGEAKLLGDQSPIVVDGRSYLPVASVASMLGFEVEYVDSTRTIKLTNDATATIPTDGTYKVSGMTFYDVTVENGEYGWDVAAELKNDSGKDVEGMIFTVTFYDGDNKRIGTAQGTVSDLVAGGTKTVSFLAMDDYTGYKTIKFQIDTSY